MLSECHTRLELLPELSYCKSAESATMVSLSLWKTLLFIAPLSLVANLASAALPDGRLHGNMLRPPAIPIVNVPTGAPVISRNGTVLPPYDTVYEFDQLIDHNNPSLGTFKQRFWHTWEFYEPGNLFHVRSGSVAYLIV